MVDGQNRAAYGPLADGEATSHKNNFSCYTWLLGVISARQLCKGLFALTQTFPAFVYYALALKDSGESGVISQNPGTEWDALASLSVNFAAYFDMGLDTFELMNNAGYFFPFKMAHQYLTGEISFQALQKTFDEAIHHKIPLQMLKGEAPTTEQVRAFLTLLEESMQLAAIYFSSPFLSAQSDLIPALNNEFFRWYARYYALTYKPGLVLLISLIKQGFLYYFSPSQRDDVILKNTIDEALEHATNEIHNKILLEKTPVQFNIMEQLDQIKNAADDTAKKEAIEQTLINAFSELESSSGKLTTRFLATFLIGYASAVAGSTGYGRTVFTDPEFSDIEKASAIILDNLFILIMAYKFAQEVAYRFIPVDKFLKTTYGQLYSALWVIGYIVLAGSSWRPSWYNNKEIVSGVDQTWRIVFFWVCWVGTDIFNGSFMHALLKDFSGLLYRCTHDIEAEKTPYGLTVYLGLLKDELSTYLKTLDSTERRSLIKNTANRKLNTANFAEKLCRAVGWANSIEELFAPQTPSHPDYSPERDQLETKYSIASAVGALLISVLVATDSVALNENSALTYVLLGLVTTAASAALAYQINQEEEQQQTPSRKKPSQQALAVLSIGLVYSFGTFSAEMLSQVFCTVILTMKDTPAAILPIIAVPGSLFAVKVGAEVFMREQPLRDNPIITRVAAEEYTV